MRHLVRPSALVATYFDTLAPNQVATARALQQVVLGAAPQLEQTVKWGNLTFICEGRNLLAIVTHKAHAHLQVFNGAALAREFPELEGVGKGIRHLKLRYAQPLDADLIHDLVRASVALGVRREE
ncbi:MAG: DUF1801 domain-containing protein [Burkholderiales bacterium]|jgi:hypothetical protein|nr:DUF1801 domain-containing protein [Burkholderiales bacterium]MBP6249877.1 DUF1801 domain-containing protein [Leptothrix sp. (in: b-proteobacteria)]MBP7519722.1 DUF1801 domain-containing protein [Leptothrix sp. (in: b-proteobacteria)]HQY08675.1 DUF1801 domain-containing protein [Burkholderiaceae bacterium]